MKKTFALLSLALFTFAVGMALAADGEALYKSACAGCHGAEGQQGGAPLKDQAPDAIVEKLRGYADGMYGGEKKQVMVNIVKKHSAEEMKAVADYIGKK